jgi:hypothetical protein
MRAASEIGEFSRGSCSLRELGVAQEQRLRAVQRRQLVHVVVDRLMRRAGPGAGLSLLAHGRVASRTLGGHGSPAHWPSAKAAEPGE